MLLNAVHHQRAHRRVLRLTYFGIAHVGNKKRVTETDAIIGTIHHLPLKTFEGGGLDLYE